MIRRSTLRLALVQDVVRYYQCLEVSVIRCYPAILTFRAETRTENPEKTLFGDARYDGIMCYVLLYLSVLRGSPPTRVEAHGNTILTRLLMIPVDGSSVCTTTEAPLAEREAFCVCERRLEITVHTCRRGNFQRDAASPSLWPQAAPQGTTRIVASRMEARVGCSAVETTSG